MTARSVRKGWLLGLRRRAGVLALLFAVVVLVGIHRTAALAEAIADDDLCSAMAFLGSRAPAPALDPTDVADDSHACCDLGLCLDSTALPPQAPAFHAVAAALGPRRPGRRPSESPRPRRRTANSPRAPPAH